MAPTKFTLWLSLASLLLSSVSQGTLVIGGFSAARVGPGSIDGAYTEEFRAAVLEKYPDATFVSSASLTSDFLGTVDFLIAGAPSFIGAISLTPDEQTNLLNYVKSGGGALIFVDNDDYGGVPTSDNANETFLDPFGVDSAGKINALAFATVTQPTNPVVTGPFGHVGTIAGYYPGWFDDVGPYATTVATYDSNGEPEPAVLAIPSSALAPDSGRVVFISDADMLVDSADSGLFGVADNKTLILNSIVPEPSVLSMGACALTVLASRRRRRP